MKRRGEFWGIVIALGIIVGALAASVWVMPDLKERKDWVATVIALVAVVFAGFTFAWDLWNRMPRVSCRPTDHEGNFGVLVHNTGSVRVNIDQVRLQVDGGTPTNLVRVGSNAVLEPEDTVIFYHTTTYDRDLQSCRVFVHSPTALLRTCMGPEFLSAVSGSGARLVTKIERDREEEGRSHG